MAISQSARQRVWIRLVYGSRAKAALAYAGTLFLCLVALVWVLKLRHASFSMYIPFFYVSDGIWGAVLTKGIMENGWFMFNSFVGAPTGLNVLDFPTADNLHFAVIKLISLFAGNYVLVMNTFFLATFFLTVITSLFVFKRLNISYPVAALGSLLFAFQPYHLLRGEGHLFLSGIYVIPLTALAVMRFFSQSPPLIKQDESGRDVFELRSLRSAGYCLIALLTASAGIYYAFFACFFLAMAGGYSALSYKSFKRLVAAGAIIAVIGSGFLINLSPSIVHQYKYGKNEEVAQRTAFESLAHGMIFAQLVLPVNGHRIDYLSNLKANFRNEMRYFVNENEMASLGVVGSLGLLLSLGWLLLARGRHEKKENKHHFSLLDGASVLNVMAVLLGTIGGLGVLFAFFVSPEIRAYNRISIYIAFFSILSVLLFIEVLRRKYVKTVISRICYFGVLVIILVGGMLDQTTDSMIPAYTDISKNFASDESFVRMIEERVPEGAMIFQLPYMPFPESLPINRMSSYDHFKAYLHSRTLRWSYGNMKGREGDLWQRGIAAKPVNELVPELIATGFSGVYVNRLGYGDGGVEIQRQLEDELKVKPLINDEGSLLFFAFDDYVKRTS